MTFDNLTSISPIDGRYSAKTGPLKAIFSEYGLIKYRLLVEVRWLEAMSKNSQISEVPGFDLSGFTNAYAKFRFTLCPHSPDVIVPTTLSSSISEAPL